MSDKCNQGDAPTKGPMNTAAWNRVVESADAYHAQQAGGIARVPPAHGRNWHSIVNLQNQTGYDVRQGEVLEFDESPLDLPNNHELYLDGKTPDSFRTGWGVALEPMLHATSGPQNSAPFLTNGVCMAKVKIRSESHGYAVRMPDSRVLESSNYGPILIHHKIPVDPEEESPSLPEERDCLVELVKQSRWFLALASSLNPGLYTPGSSGSSQFHGFQYLSPSSNVPFELDGDGYLVVKELLWPCFINTAISISVPYVRNNWSQVTVYLQRETSPGSGTWTQVGNYGTLFSAWPDLPILSGGGGGNATVCNLTTGIGVGKDAKFRIRSDVSYSGTAPQVNVSCPACTFFYR
jgi:hypothetical protein